MDATLRDNSRTSSSSSLNNLSSEGVSFIAINEPLSNLFTSSKNGNYKNKINFIFNECLNTRFVKQSYNLGWYNIWNSYIIIN